MYDDRLFNEVFKLTHISAKRVGLYQRERQGGNHFFLLVLFVLVLQEMVRQFEYIIHTLSKGWDIDGNGVQAKK
jgi:hypothetical protein